MILKNVLVRIGREVVSWVVSLVDAVPPYRYVDAHLESKFEDDRRKCYVCLGGVTVEVDRATYEELSIGERLRMRHTRRNKAVNIDRFASEEENNQAPPS